MEKMRLRRRILQRLLSLRTNKLYAVADYLREYYINIVGVPASRISTIYNGVDVETYAPWDKNAGREERLKLGVPADEILVGSVGTLYWVKDPENFLTAAALVLQQREDVSFLWVGGGPLKETLQARARELGIEGKIHFLGWRDDVSNILAALDVFVLPSLIEGFSYSILEAMASGLPVVATDVGGNSELVQNNQTGFLVPPRKQELLADALLKLISQKSLRIDLGRKARQRVEEKFNLQNMVQRYQQMYLTGLFGIPSAAQVFQTESVHGAH
jgi:glycosyltransferase involved in cell wall biosynthesis